MGLLPLTYRRPAHVDEGFVRTDTQDTTDTHQTQTSTVAASSTNEKTNVSLRSGQSNDSSGIPSALSFDRIIEGGTCPPCTLRDFMNFLLYVEHSAENLQFYLWYRDYVRRFNEATTSDIALAPEWTKTMEEQTTARLRKEHMARMRQQPEAAQNISGFDFNFEKSSHESPDLEHDPFTTPPGSACGTESRPSESQYTDSHSATHRSQAKDAFLAAGVKQPFTIQPFREEIDRVIATYIVGNAPRQLNLSAREQRALLTGLAYTTHPSAFSKVAQNVETSLRRQAHPNFIRWSICNGNRPRVVFARILGVSLIVIAFVVAILLTLSRAGRGYRALAAIGWVMGISTLVAAWKGMCVVLHGMHHRHVRPWELFENDARDSSESGEKNSFDSFGSSNSYEEEPWIVKYQKRNIVRKVFDREVWVQEPALRQIQDTIFVQAMLAALLAGGALTAIFVNLPAGNFF